MLLRQQATWSHCRCQICSTQYVPLSWSCGLTRSAAAFFGSCRHLELLLLLLCSLWTSTTARWCSVWSRHHWPFAARHQLPAVDSDAMLRVSGNELQVIMTVRHPISLCILAANIHQLVDEIGSCCSLHWVYRFTTIYHIVQNQLTAIFMDTAYDVDVEDLRAQANASMPASYIAN